MSAHHRYRGMNHTEDRDRIAEWPPPLMEGRDGAEAFAATRIVTDVDCGALTHLLVKNLSDQTSFDVHMNAKS
jgi:malate dehydrogenase (quinone)